MNQHALLLVGSPKQERSTSNSLGTYLLDRLNERGFETEKMQINLITSGEEKIKFLQALDRTDIFIIAFPLYVDSLPSSVIRTLELVNDHRRSNKIQKNQKILAIVICGFPEAKHNKTALRICRQFAKESGFEWAGGLAAGMGEAIAGKQLEDSGSMVRNIRKSLDMTADALCEGKTVPKKAVDLMGKHLMPRWMYIIFGNRGWKSKAKKYGVKDNINNQPYQ